MTANIFLDTNVFLYSIDEDPAAERKRERAQQVILSERWCWSVQVASEFYVNATSPKRPFRLTASTALALVQNWLVLPTLDLTPALFLDAASIQQRYPLSYWDAAILAAAKQMGCRTVFSEDMSGGSDYDGVTVVNPFQDVTI